ncbi:hypothetical protein ACJMK2_037095 [Sinanodonta woodiana]|uniref:Uncharacterized protein n=1 Tax=Sinanodonta woodiana TaxID=1069815 RepID=A0ABD3WJ76_SINWO
MAQQKIHEKQNITTRTAIRLTDINSTTTALQNTSTALKSKDGTLKAITAEYRSHWDIWNNIHLMKEAMIKCGNQQTLPILKIIKAFQINTFNTHNRVSHENNIINNNNNNNKTRPTAEQTTEMVSYISDLAETNSESDT